MTISITAQQVIERAALRHWSFVDSVVPDGAMLAFLDDRQRGILLAVIEDVEALLGETSQVDTSGTQTLVGLDDFGAPYFATTTETAYALKFAGGVPYIDTSTPFIVDPFGADGDIPGFPLPTDLLRLISVQAVSSSQPIGSQPLEVTILEQRNAAAHGGSLQLRAFVSVSRLVPVRIATTDLWSTVTSLLFSMVRCPALTSLSDTITLPVPCVDALVAAVAEMMASLSRDCPQADKTRFEKQRAEANAMVFKSASSILDAVTSSSVIIR